MDGFRCGMHEHDVHVARKMLVCLQASYSLLSALDTGMETLVTGPSTNPQTLASALTAFQATLPFSASTNTMISELSDYIVSFLMRC